MSKKEDEKVARCVICNQEFTKKQLDLDNDSPGLGCPNCGDIGAPANPKDDVMVKINWYELRILAGWAERWAMAIEKEYPNATPTVGCIVIRLEKQHPNKTPLTITNEIEQLKNKYPNIEPTHPEDKDIINEENNEEYNEEDTK